MKWLEAICLVVLTAAAVFLLTEGGLLLKDARKDLDANSQKLDATLTDTRRVILAAGGAVANIEKDSRSWKEQQDRIAKSTQSAMNTLNASLLALNGLESMATSVLDSQQKSLTQLESTASKSIETATQSVASLQPPAIASLQNLAASAASLNQAITETAPTIQDTAANLDATTKDVREVTAAYKQKLLHPIHSFWQDLKTASEWLVTGLEAHAYWP
jgi:ABC-type transporter Mla subunit MlaD